MLAFKRSKLSFVKGSLVMSDTLVDADISTQFVPKS